MSKHVVVVQRWEEVGFPLGAKPDGYTLHLNEEARKKYLDIFWSKMPEKSKMPEIYSRPSGLAYDAYVSLEVYTQVWAQRHEMGHKVPHIENTSYPGEPGYSDEDAALALR